MGRFDNYTPDEKRRISVIAARLVEGRIVKGEIPCTDEAIRAAMPQAVEDARQVVLATDEFLAG
jgi:hypothetical protein